MINSTLPTIKEVLEKVKEKKIKEKRKSKSKRTREGKRQTYFCIGVCDIWKKGKPIHTTINILKKKYDIKWLRKSMSYNRFWKGSGCAYQYSNDRKCGYEHYCSSCFKKSGVKEKHKAYYCDPAAVKTPITGSGGTAAVTSG